MGGCAPSSTLGGANPLNSEQYDHNFSARPGASSASTDFFLSGATYDVAVMVLFLFQMVFMDTH